MGLEDYTYARYRCAIDRKEDARLFLSLSVSCVLDLMNIAGLTLDEIPQELHHFGVATNSGNNILDRLDPLANIRNPWDRISLYFALPVSLKAFKAYRRAHGLETPRATELAQYAEDTAREAQKKDR